MSAYLAVGTLVSAIDLPLWNALLTASVDTFLMVGLTQIVLWVRDHPERGVQTLTALAGTGALVGLISLPLLAGLHAAEGVVLALQGLLWLGLVVWSVVIMGHILRHALAVPMLAGSGVALVYVYISFKVMNALVFQAN